MSSDELNYFRARAIEERERAGAATSSAIRAVHLELALRYDQLAGELRRTEELQLSHDAVRRSLDLLRTTNVMVEY